MNLKRGGRSQRTVAVDGWDAVGEAWVPEICKCDVKANDQFPTGTDYSVKKRSILCSDLDRIADQYRLIRIAGQQFIVESEQANIWRGGAYQYFYQVRLAAYSASIYSYVTSPAASGMPGQPVRTLQTTTPCDVEGAGQEDSREFDAAAYSRVRLHFPGNVVVNKDSEVDISGRTYNVASVVPFSKMWTALALARGETA